MSIDKEDLIKMLDGVRSGALEIKPCLVGHRDLKEFLMYHYPDVTYKTEYSKHKIFIQVLVLDEYDNDRANDAMEELRERIPVGIDFKVEYTSDKYHFDDRDMPF